MNDVFQTINGGDFTVATFVRAADDGDFVVFAYRNRADLLDPRGSGGG